MLEQIALFTGVLGLLLIVFSLLYGLIGAKWKSKAFGWLMGIGITLMIGSWVMFIIPEPSQGSGSAGIPAGEQ